MSSKYRRLNFFPNRYRIHCVMIPIGIFEKNALDPPWPWLFRSDNMSLMIEALPESGASGVAFEGSVCFFFGMPAICGLPNSCGVVVTVVIAILCYIWDSFFVWLISYILFSNHLANLRYHPSTVDGTNPAKLNCFCWVGPSFSPPKTSIVFKSHRVYKISPMGEWVSVVDS